MMFPVSTKILRPARRGRRPREQGPALDRARLVETALSFARSGGLESLNIRTVASGLGVSPRLIYHHVRDKEELLALLTDAVLDGRMPDLAPDDWETRLRNVAQAVQFAYREYPGSAAFILSRSANRLEQPNALKIRTALFEAFAQAGLEREQQHEMLVLFSIIVLGNVVVAESLPDEGRLAMQRETLEAAFARGVEMLVAAVRAAGAAAG